jgi:hypothetical protein
MFISTRVTVDIFSGKVLHREGHEYSGPIEFCKGDSELKDQETSQANFTKSLQAAFSTQFQQQGALLSFLNPKLESMITNPTGLDPATKAAMTTSAIDQSATDYTNAVKGYQASTAGRGGPTALPSGVDAQVKGQIAAGQAGEESSALNSIQQQDAQLKNTNQWNAIRSLSGDAELENPNSYAGSANQGSGVVGTLGAEYNQTQQNSFWNKLGDSFATGLGGELAGGKGGIAPLYGG